MARTSAVDMAKQAGIAPKRFRAALRGENSSWHKRSARWTVDVGTPEHVAMEQVLRRVSN
jgi:hypothetical protein